MVMTKSASICDYFKKLNHAQPKKRRFPHGGWDVSPPRTRRKSSSTSPSADDGFQAKIHMLSNSSSAHHTLSGTDAMATSQQRPPSQRRLPNRSVLTPAPGSSIEPEQPRYSSLSPMSDAATMTSPPPLPSSTSTAQDTSTGIARPYTTPLPPPGKPLSREYLVSGSQTILTSSQRIVKDGEIMIRNSDDESDDSLEDLATLFGRDRKLHQSSPQLDVQLPYPDDETGLTTRRKAAKATRANQLTSRLSNMPRKYKYSLDVLGMQRKQDEAARESMARAQSLLDSLDQRTGSTSVKKPAIGTDLIQSAMQDHGDEDGINRLRAAIQRTEALDQHRSWSFFDENRGDPSFELPDFPAIEDERVGRLFGQDLSRQQAFLSGYAGEYATKAGLPDEVLLWMMDAICVESRIDLRYSYISTLSHATAQFSPLLTPSNIDELFRKLGASAAATDNEATVVPQVILSQNVEARSRPNLLSVLILLGSIAGDMTADSRIHLLNTLCRLALDYSIITDCHIISALGEVFANLIISIPEESLKRELQVILTTVFHTVSDATLRLQLIQMIPAWPSRVLLLRQRLALAFFFQDSRYLSKQVEDLVDLKTIIRRLKSPHFDIRQDTDYGELAASIGMLSIGIDCGDPPPSSAVKEEKTAFDSDVDSLTLKVKDMFSDIIDTGASHMKRTEAKEVLEGFQRRLEYSIRTRPKKKLIFGDAEVAPLQMQIDTHFPKIPRAL